MSTVIKVENLSKQYRLGQVGTGTLSHDLNRWWHKIKGNEDPYLKIGDLNDRSKKGESDFVWVLKNINFEVSQGDVLGIIGKNGAGKSTLLKILSRVTGPTSGEIKIKGRVASLLEVGTGFHPELTGRENIYLNGAILGMTKKEISSKFDEIVDFSGVERYIDTPVKRYSSGMYVRLAFAVAAHLEPEILIVDEVLAVGDSEFQRKCLGKMKDVSSQGRTVLFVSHNMAAMNNLCTKGLLLANGQVKYAGDINQTIVQYQEQNKTLDISESYTKLNIENKEVELIKASVVNFQLENKESYSINEDIFITVKLSCNEIIADICGYIIVKNINDEVYIESDTYDYPPNILNEIKIGDNEYLIKINKNVLSFGEYIVYFNFSSTYSKNFNIESPKEILKFSVYDLETRRGIKRKSLTSQLLKWEINYVK